MTRMIYCEKNLSGENPQEGGEGEVHMPIENMTLPANTQNLQFQTITMQNDEVYRI